MKIHLPHLLILLSATASSQGAILVATTKSATPFTVSSTDLGQAVGNVYTGGGTGASGLLSGEAAQLFNGNVGNADGDDFDSGEVSIAVGNTLTVTFNTTLNTLGYDITGITSVFGWDVGGNGRSNQGYSIVLTFMNNSTATLASGVWEPNAPASYWTQVAFTNDGGGLLSSDTVKLNGGSANPGTGISASGVKAITFTNFSAANATGVVIAREFDVFGAATVPEPGVPLLSLVGLGVILRRRRP